MTVAAKPIWRPIAISSAISATGRATRRKKIQTTAPSWHREGLPRPWHTRTHARRTHAWHLIGRPEPDLHQVR